MRELLYKKIGYNGGFCFFWKAEFLGIKENGVSEKTHSVVEGGKNDTLEGWKNQRIKPKY